MFTRSIRGAIGSVSCGRCQLQIFRHFNFSPNIIEKTHIVKHVKPLPTTPPGKHQRPPTDKQELQRYDFVQDSGVVNYPPVRVILVKSVDGIGIRGDVVSVSSEDFHNLLFPTGCAIYATPYDLKLLEQRKQAGEFSKLAPEDMLSYEYKKTARTLNKMIKITMTFDDSWTLEKQHIRINLRRAGFIVSEDNIVMPSETIKGPNKNLQGGIITFYVKHTANSIIPVLGRIDQVSAKGTQLIVGAAKDETMEEVTAPPIYYSSTHLELTDDEIRALMASRETSDKKQSMQASS